MQSLLFYQDFGSLTFFIVTILWSLLKLAFARARAFFQSDLNFVCSTQQTPPTHCPSSHPPVDRWPLLLTAIAVY